MRMSRWSATVFAMVLGAAGCGSDDPSGQGGTSSVAATSDGGTADTAPADTAAASTMADSTSTAASPSPGSIPEPTVATSAPASPVSTCAALRDVDLDGLLGEPAGPPEEATDAFGAECTVAAADPDSRGQIVLRVTSNAAEENYENSRQQFGVDAEISGLGDEAFASVDQRFEETMEMFGTDSTVDAPGDEAFHSGPVLAVRSGDTAFVLWVLGDIMLGADVDDAELERAMTRVLANADD